MATNNTHTLIGGQVLVGVHPSSQCKGEHCTIHNFSDHHMVDWPQNWRSDRGIMERICPHGVGHPDPDDPKSIDPYENIHGCDGCCMGDEFSVVMFNLDSLNHPYAGDAMDYIEKITSDLKTFRSLGDQLINALMYYIGDQDLPEDLQDLFNTWKEISKN